MPGATQSLEEVVEGLQSAKQGIMTIIQQDPGYRNNISDLGGAYDGGTGAAWLQIQKDLCEYVTIEQTLLDPVHHYTTTTMTGFPVCADATGDEQGLQLQHFFEVLEEYWHKPAALAVLMDHAVYTSSPSIFSVALPLRKGMEASLSPFDNLLVSAACVRESGGGRQRELSTWYGRCNGVHRGGGVPPYQVPMERRTLTPAGLEVHGKTTSRVDTFMETTDVLLSGAGCHLSASMRDAMRSGARDMMDQFFEHTKDLHSQRRICIALPHSATPAAATLGGEEDSDGCALQSGMPGDTLSIYHAMAPSDPRRGLATVVVTDHPGGIVGSRGSYTHVAMLDTVNHANEHYTQRHFVASFIKLAKIAVAAKVGLDSDVDPNTVLNIDDFDTVKINPSMTFYWGTVVDLTRVEAPRKPQQKFNVGMLVHTMRRLPVGSSRAAPLVLPPRTATPIGTHPVQAGEAAAESGGGGLEEWLAERCDTIRCKNRFSGFCESWPPPGHGA